MARNDGKNRVPPKPKRRRGVVGIQPRLRGGRWVWRAVCTIDGHRRVGPQRDDQETAHRDYLDLREQGRAAPTSLTTLDVGLAAVIAEKIARGTAKPRSVAAERTVCNALLRAWNGDAPLTKIATAEEIHWYIRTAQENGRTLATIKDKDLRVLRKVLRIAGIAWPDNVRPIRPPAPSMAFFEPEELAPLIERVRSEALRDRAGRPIKAKGRERDADLFLLIACTGLRSGEVGRLNVDHFDVERRLITVTNEKDHQSVARVPYPEAAAAAVSRLIDSAMPDGRLLEKGERTLGLAFERWKDRLREPRLSGRALRHSHVTMALLDTGDPAAAREAGRHRSLVTTNRYVHEVSALRVKRVAALDDRFRDLGGRSPDAESS